MSKSIQKAAANTSKEESLNSQAPVKQAPLKGAWGSNRLSRKEDSVPAASTSTLQDPAIIVANTNSSFTSHLPYTAHVFEISLANLRGEVVMVHLRDGSIYEGVFDKPVVDASTLTYSFVLHWAQKQTASRLPEFFIPTRTTTVLKSSSPFVELMTFSSQDVLALRAPGFVPPHRNVSFATDTQISAAKQVQQRQLTKWDADAFAEELPLDTTTSLEDMIRRTGNTKWDQFTVNAKLAPTLEFDMNKYSTEIDTSAADYEQTLAEANRIAVAIERGATTDKVILRDRRSVELDADDDEDDNFSTVLQDRDDKNGKGRKNKTNGANGKKDNFLKEKEVVKEVVKEGVYVPPAKRDAAWKAREEEEKRKKLEELQALEQQRLREEEEKRREEAERAKKAEEERLRKEEEERKAAEEKKKQEERAKQEKEEHARREEEQKPKQKLTADAPAFKPSAAAAAFVPGQASFAPTYPSYPPAYSHQPAYGQPHYARGPRDVDHGYPYSAPRYPTTAAPARYGAAAPARPPVEEKKEEKQIPAAASAPVYRGDVLAPKEAEKTAAAETKTTKPATETEIVKAEIVKTEAAAPAAAVSEKSEKPKDEEKVVKSTEVKDVAAKPVTDKAKDVEESKESEKKHSPVEEKPQEKSVPEQPKKSEAAETKETKSEDSSKPKLSASAPEFKLSTKAPEFIPSGRPIVEKVDRRPMRPEIPENAYFPEDAVAVPLGPNGMPVGHPVPVSHIAMVVPMSGPHGPMAPHPMQFQGAPGANRRKDNGQPPMQHPGVPPQHVRQMPQGTREDGSNGMPGYPQHMGMQPGQPMSGMPMMMPGRVVQGGMAVAGHVGNVGPMPVHGQMTQMRAPMPMNGAAGPYGHMGYPPQHMAYAGPGPAGGVPPQYGMNQYSYPPGADVGLDKKAPRGFKKGDGKEFHKEKGPRA